MADEDEDDFTEQRRCNDCEAEYVDGGADECPHCGSEDTAIIDPDEEDEDEDDDDDLEDEDEDGDDEEEV